MVITIFGLGFVGLTTALGFAEYGHKIYGIETDEERLHTVRSGSLPFLEPGLDEALARHLQRDFFPIALPDLEEAIAESDCIYYCVGTPYGKDGQAELSYLFEAIDQTLARIRDERFRVLVVKSTVPPSTCAKQIVPSLEDKGVKLGDKIGLANNPEFLREGHCWDDFMGADRIVLGVNDAQSQELLCRLYASVDVPLFCVSLNTGEFIKYLSNALLATLISFSNEMSMVADTVGDIDVARAFRILHLDKRWGGCDMASYVYPGCGYGGYCLPKDTNALYAVLKTMGFEANLLREVIVVNDTMPQVIVRRIDQAVKGNKQVKLGFLGLSFKPGSDDVRDAPSAKIIRYLLDEGYSNILAYDPVANEEFKKHYTLTIDYVDQYPKILEQADAFVITTAWPEFRHIESETTKPVVDCRYML